MPETDVVKPTDDEMEYFARSSCKHCYGRGWTGTFSTVNHKGSKIDEKVACRCVLKAMVREQKTNTIRVIEGV